MSLEVRQAATRSVAQRFTNTLSIRHWHGRGRQKEATWTPDPVYVTMKPETALATGALIRERDKESGKVEIYLAADWYWNGSYVHQLDGDGKPRRWRNHRWYRGALVRRPD